MPATYIGYNQQALNGEISYKENKEGMVEYTVRNLIRGDINVTTPNINDSLSVDGQSLKVTNVSVEIANPDFREVVTTYQGKSSTTSIQYDVTNATGEEPIATNYNFLVTHDNSDSIVNFAGGTITAGVTCNGGAAVFDADGAFSHFNKGAKRNLFGVTSYLNPAVTFRRCFTTNTQPDLSLVGRIITPEAGFPNIQAPRTWLLTAIAYQKKGNTYDVTQDYRASDTKGWNTFIYGASIAAPTP
jgi:hypothetical protein